MRKFFILLAAVFVCSCSNNGLDKPITETMTVEEIRANIKEYAEFAEFYEEVQDMREWVMQNEITQAKYGDMTYGRLLKYAKRLKDTSFVSKVSKQLREEYNSIYPDYTPQVDSIMNYWRNYMQENQLDKYVKIEFAELWKEYYSYSNEIKSVNIGFKVTPLKGTIQQLVFEYNIKSKINSDGKFDEINSHRCLASEPIRHTKTLYWEANYSDEKYLKNKTNAEVKRDYDFMFKVVKVRVGGVNIEEKKEDIPFCVHMALKYCTEGNNYYADDIIKEFINKDYVEFYKWATPRYNAIRKEIDSDVFEMTQAFVEYKTEKSKSEKD